MGNGVINGEITIVVNYAANLVINNYGYVVIGVVGTDVCKEYRDVLSSH